MNTRAMNVFMSIYSGSMRHRLIHRKTQMGRLAKRMGTTEAQLRHTYETYYAHGVGQNEWCRWIAEGSISIDGREFNE